MMMKAAPAPVAVWLAPGVKLRREYFGGLAFDPRTGNTVELDRGAFRLAELARCGISVGEALDLITAEGLEQGDSEEALSGVITSLLDLHIVEEAGEGHCTPDAAPPRPGPWPPGPPLTGPEAVHWAITFRCNAACPDCYAARHRRGEAAELATKDALRLVDRVAGWGAFQLAIGGGDPLLREDLPVVVRHARRRGLTVHLTMDMEASGGVGVDDTLMENLTCLQIGIRHEQLIDAAWAGHNVLPAELCRRAAAHGVSIGANLVLCRTVVDHFEEAVQRLIEAGFRRITLLRYKPPGSPERWFAERPEPASLLGIEERIARQVERYPGLALRIDCALAFLERHLSRDVARHAGLRGCVAGARIVALGPDGSVYPCSQLVAPRFRAGNILEEDPARIWRESKVLRKYRHRRARKIFRQTSCSACRVVEQCGGCPALSSDGFGADPGCPEPLLPPPRHLGPDGRVADVQRYLIGRQSISVSEYMERYGVGQRRAVSELRQCPGLTLVEWEGDGPRKGSGGRKTDRYELLSDRTIRDIQDVIGYTAGGAPYATLEEIERWVGSPTAGAAYPAWLRQREPEGGERPGGPRKGQRRRR